MHYTILLGDRNKFIKFAYFPSRKYPIIVTKKLFTSLFSICGNRPSKQLKSSNQTNYLPEYLHLTVKFNSDFFFSAHYLSCNIQCVFSHSRLIIYYLASIFKDYKWHKMLQICEFSTMRLKDETDSHNSDDNYLHSFTIFKPINGFF